MLTQEIICPTSLILVAWFRALQLPSVVGKKPINIIHIVPLLSEIYTEFLNTGDCTSTKVCFADH